MRRRALALAAFFALLFPIAIASAFTSPTVAAPGGNISAPVNVGTVNQVKNANLGVNGLAVFGNTLLQASSYLNWGATSGTTGYGVWDNGGVMYFKNSGGTWADLNTIMQNYLTLNGYTSGGASQWTTSGTSIYYNTGNVGIGTVAPTIKLAVGDSDTGLNSAGDGALDIYANNVNTMSVRSWGVGIGNTSPSTKLQIGDGGDGWVNGLTIHSNSPTIYLRDVDGRGAMIHNNTNTLYFLRSCGTTGNPAGGNDWCAAANGWWPLYIDLENNNAVFGGNVYAFAFIYNSDKRLKKNVQPLTDPLSRVLQLRGVTFNWKSAGMPKGTQIGFIAQDVEKVLPELVSTDASTTLKSVDYAKVTPLLVEAMRVQEAKIQAQQKEIDELKHAIDALRKNP